jgi:hypothetical protein
VHYCSKGVWLSLCPLILCSPVSADVDAGGPRAALQPVGGDRRHCRRHRSAHPTVSPSHAGLHWAHGWTPVPGQAGPVWAQGWVPPADAAGWGRLVRAVALPLPCHPSPPPAPPPPSYWHAHQRTRTCSKYDQAQLFACPAFMRLAPFGWLTQAGCVCDASLCAPLPSSPHTLRVQSKLLVSTGAP